MFKTFISVTLLSTALFGGVSLWQASHISSLERAEIKMEEMIRDTDMLGQMLREICEGAAGCYAEDWLSDNGVEQALKEARIMLLASAKISWLDRVVHGEYFLSQIDAQRILLEQKYDALKRYFVYVRIKQREFPGSSPVRVKEQGGETPSGAPEVFWDPAVGNFYEKNQQWISQDGKWVWQDSQWMPAAASVNPGVQVPMAFYSPDLESLKDEKK